MRNWIIGAAALLAVAAPSVAMADATGYVGVNYGNVDAGGAADEDFYGIDTAIGFHGSGSLRFEIDAAVTDGDDTDSAFGVTGHILTDVDHVSWGGFLGVADSDSSDTTWFGGLEANKYFTNWTLAGAIFYGNNDEFDVDGYGVNVEARAFVHDNFRLEGNIGYANIDAGAVDDDVTIYGVGGEYLFASWPISLGARYGTADSDFGDVDTWSVFARYNWGGGTLRDRDRRAGQANLTSLGFIF
ncbi:MAG: hypothetical protein AB7H66_06480 [Hyphomonadaceae bacterium]